MLNFAEVGVFKALLEHVFEEKIARSTVNAQRSSFKKLPVVDIAPVKSEIVVNEEIYGVSTPKSKNGAQRSPSKLEKVF